MDSAIDLDTPAGASALSAPRGKLGLALVAAAAFCMVVGAAYEILGRLGLTEYGSWTGVRPLERKLGLLQSFSARGDIDALFVGSSIVDFGFSARLFSELMSRHLGREYRAFNFGTGGAEVRTLPKLYRLARTVTRPKAVFVLVPPEHKLGEAIQDGTPDYALRHAPIGPFMHNQSLLDLDKAIWDTPLLKYAPAARDMAIYGAYDNLQGVGMEAYAVDTHGDRVSYLMTWAQDELPASKRASESQVAPFRDAAGSDERSRQRLADFYFAPIDIEAMDELRRMVERDGGRIFVLSHAPAAALWGGMRDDPDYAAGRRGFYKALCERLGATFVDVAQTLDIPTYAVADMTHLNTYGAEMYTRAAFGAIAGVDGASAETRAVRMRPPPKGLFPTTDRTFNTYVSLVRRPANEADRLLRFKLVDTLAVPPLPEQDLYAALRTPANEDIVTPAIPIGPHEFVAEVDLPSAPQDEAIVLRIVYGEGASRMAANNPLEDYEWITSFPRKPLPPTRSGGEAQIVAWPPVRYPGQSLYVGMRPGASLPAAVSLRLEPRSSSGPGLDLGTASGDFGKLVKVPLPADAKPGEYVLRVRDVATDRPLDPAPEVEIALPPSAMEPPRILVDTKLPPQGGHINVRWSGVRKTLPHDWLGLFPVGGGPASRLGFIYTKGLSEGQVQFPLTADAAAKLQHGRYEFRLYGGRGWEVLAVSDTFTLEPSPESRAAADGSTGKR